ncbi:MAG: GNAT family N-acetyltransferase [Clostridiales bacterium]|nr:GNAT family N-acetyltransferase [Clostridiales bacterium]
MFFPDKTFTLKDGRTALLRAPRREDAAAVLDCFITTAGETEFLLNYPEEIAFTVEGEEAFLMSARESADELMIICEVEGQVAGSCNLMFKRRIKNRHIATLGISLKKAYWSLGIGGALMAEVIRAARQREGVRFIDLEVVQDNARAIALYEKMGFELVCVKPDAFRFRDGTFHGECLMRLKL